jgi:hypothetical protein
MATNNLTVPARARLTSILEAVTFLIVTQEEHPEYLKDEDIALQNFDADIWDLQDRVCERSEGLDQDQEEEEEE